MAVSGIRWKQGDYIRLGQAVSLFNRTINEHKTLENSLYLPEEADYKDLKNTIQTRQELNRVISSLRSITNKNALNLYETEAGEQITNWERKNLSKLSQNIIKRLTGELTELYKPLDTGFSPVEMGHYRPREIEATIEQLNNLEKLQGEKFTRLKNKINYLGRADYTYKKARTYRENFMEELTELKNIDPAFQEVYNYFNRIKNPVTFFETAQKSSILQDFFVWYKTPLNFGDFNSTEELAESILANYI